MPEFTVVKTSKKERRNQHIMMQEKMGHCPLCHKPVLNEGMFTSFASFGMRCPWCQAGLRITIQPSVIVQAAITNPFPIK
jgi:hypothetical protein